MTRDQLTQHLQKMQQQANGLQQQADQALAQLTATRGAIQMLEILIQECEDDDLSSQTNIDEQD